MKKILCTLTGAALLYSLVQLTSTNIHGLEKFVKLAKAQATFSSSEIGFLILFFVTLELILCFVKIIWITLTLTLKWNKFTNPFEWSCCCDFGYCVFFADDALD